MSKVRRRRVPVKRRKSSNEINWVALFLLAFFAFLVGFVSYSPEKSKEKRILEQLPQEKPVWTISAEYKNPVPGSDFGMLHWDLKRYAIDMFAPTGTPVYAASSGVVIKSGLGKGKKSGLRVTIQDGRAEVFYGHLNGINVQLGQIVQQGDLIGWVGHTGNARASSPHLHFEFFERKGKNFPRPWRDKWRKQRRT